MTPIVACAGWPLRHNVPALPYHVLTWHPPFFFARAALQTFLKAICANWFVCLAVWQSLGTSSMGGKFIACLGPVSAFVCIG